MTRYPVSRRSDLTEILHGHEIADPYRWLEDPDSTETRAWVTAQNEATEAHLTALPSREWFRSTLRDIVLRPRVGTPLSKGSVDAPRYFVTTNDGAQQQDVLLTADSLDELIESPRVVLDPNRWSDDGTTSLFAYSVSRNGRYLAYLPSEAGSDWHRIRVLDLETGTELPDEVEQSKFSTATWLPDDSSFLYTRFEVDGQWDGRQSNALGGGRMMRHTLGRGDDELVLEFDDPQLMSRPQVSHDGRFLVVSISVGTEPRNRVWLYPLESGAERTLIGEPIRLVDEPTAHWSFLRADGDALLFETDDDAPRGRIVRVGVEVGAGVDTGSGLDGAAVGALEEVVPEGEWALEFAVAAGEGLLLSRLVDVSPELTLVDRDGADIARVPIEAGAIVSANARAGSSEVFVGATSVTAPTTSYRVDAFTGDTRKLTELSRGGLVAPPVVTVRCRATSADGTEVPYWLVRRADATAQEPAPTLLYGYGGFAAPVLADYRAGWPAWLTAGGTLAIANLRGGAEFGSDWHDAGRLENKQNVFDDFVAVAEHLVETGVTTPRQLALHGRSNGGLLVGAVMTQRPDVAAVALPMVGVLDMLRFHRFTIGRAWIADYGTPDDQAQFETLLAYSPLHNLTAGTAYPATLVLTGDHDDRVVPAHSHKFTATLQHAHAGDTPVLSRVEVATGHGTGKPASVLADEWADLLAFAAEHTGLQVPPGGPAS